MANPDGYTYSRDKDRLWRKTRSPNKGTSCVGTDPNRNFGYRWQAGDHLTRHPCSHTYRGAQPFSEVETANIRDWLTAHRVKYKGHV